jgi:hypothetical protein
MQGLADHRQRVRHDEVVHRDHEHRDTAGQVRPERLSHSRRPPSTRMQMVPAGSGMALTRRCNQAVSRAAAARTTR